MRQRRRPRHAGAKVSAGVLEYLVERIVQCVSPEKIILFGSAARGAMGPNSDLDLLVIKSGDYHHVTEAQKIYRSLRDLGHAKDIVLATPEEVKEYGDCFALVIYPALREGKVIYEREAA